MPNTAKIRELNDEFRKTFVGGRVLITQGVANRSDLPVILEKVRTFDDFGPDNDPWQEHDLTAFKIGDQQFFGKIDYYDIDLSGGSPDPSDPGVTSRVLTVMLSEEY